MLLGARSFPTFLGSCPIPLDSKPRARFGLLERSDQSYHRSGVDMQTNRKEQGTQPSLTGKQ